MEKLEAPLEAKFSSLVMSIASSALMSMGHSPHASDGKVGIDQNMARFNIDLLLMLRDKTKNNLNSDDAGLLEHIIFDLQQKFLHLSSKRST